MTHEVLLGRKAKAHAAAAISCGFHSAAIQSYSSLKQSRVVVAKRLNFAL